MVEDKAYPIDVAFSFVQQDEEAAAQVDNLLKNRRQRSVGTRRWSSSNQLRITPAATLEQVPLSRHSAEGVEQAFVF